MDEPGQTQYDRWDLKLHAKSASVITETVDCLFYAKHQVKMRTQLPARWASAPLKPALNASAQPGEHFSFQLAVVNVARGDGQAVQPQTITSVTFSGLRSQVVPDM